MKFFTKYYLGFNYGINYVLLPVSVTKIYNSYYYVLFRLICGICLITCWLNIPLHCCVSNIIYMISNYHILQTVIISFIKVCVGISIIKNRSYITNTNVHGIAYITLFIRILMITIMELLGIFGFIDQIIDVINYVIDIKKIHNRKS